MDFLIFSPSENLYPKYLWIFRFFFQCFDDFFALRQKLYYCVKIGIIYWIMIELCGNRDECKKKSNKELWLLKVHTLWFDNYSMKIDDAILGNWNANVMNVLSDFMDGFNILFIWKNCCRKWNIIWIPFRKIK